jgi:hypothetical protein
VRGNRTSHQYITTLLRATALTAMLVLAACTPEQTPASAARTAAALRTPVAVPAGQTAISATPTLAGGGRPASATPQPQTTTEAKPAPANTTAATPGTRTVTASPNSVLFGADQLDQVGTSTVSWSTGTSDLGELYVSQDGGPDKLFVEGSDGSAAANWIRPGSTYEFHLYAGREHGQQLASVTVTTALVNASTDSTLTTQRPEGPASLTALPNPVLFGADQQDQVGTSTISWSTGTSALGQLYVSQDGGPDKLFVEGSDGSAKANWIRPGSRYEFHVYAGREHSQQLASVTVTTARANASTDSELTAEPNPVPADDQELGTTLITWTTGDSQGGEVWVSENGGPEKLFLNGSEGSGKANWICRDRIYEFHLYSGRGRANLLNTLTVTRAADAPSHEPPPRVQCQPEVTE